MNGIPLYWIIPIQIYWAPDPSVRDQHDPRIDECGNIHHRTVHTLSVLSGTPNIYVKKA